MDGGLDDLRTLLLVQLPERLAPFAVLIAIQQRRQRRQRLLAVGHHRHIGLHILVYLATVNIQMNNLGLLGIGLRITRHTVGEAHADSYQHVALLLLQIDGIVAMHAQHTHIQRMVGGQSAQSQHRAAGGNISFLQECLQLFLRIAQLNALTNQSQRALGIVDQLGSLAHSIHIQLGISHIAAYEVHLLRLPLHLLDLSIAGEVEHHRAWPTAAGNIESTADGPGNILSTAYLVAPLRNRLSQAHQIHLLKRIRTQCRDGHLSGYHHDGSRVEHGIGHARQRIRGTGTTGHQSHTHLAADAGIALGSMHGSLLMANQYMVETLLQSSSVVEQRIIRGHDGAARVSEDSLHPLGLQSTHQRLRASYLFLHTISIVLVVLNL